jgi:ASCH domain.
MKAVLMAFQPKWSRLIRQGKKKVEVRTKIPNLEPPYDIYMYESLGRTYKNMSEDYWSNHPDLISFDDGVTLHEGWGKVVGKFTVEKVDKIPVDSKEHEYWSKNGTCLTVDDFINYCNGNDLKALHISDLVVFEQPRELGEFKAYDKTYDKVGAFGWAFNEKEKYSPLKRAPQSFQYIEVEDRK